MSWRTVLEIYVTILPIVLASTLSTSALRLPALQRLRTPIDWGLRMPDGRRLFGDNKTWIGAMSLIVWAAILTVLWGLLNKVAPGLQMHNWMYRVHDNTLFYNIYAGSLMGLVYIIAELPNSFIKRRINITPGAIIEGIRGLPNIIIDHVDSVIGCAVVLLYLCNLTVVESVEIILVGGMTHLIVNIVLVKAGIKKNI